MFLGSPITQPALQLGDVLFDPAQQLQFLFVLRRLVGNHREFLHRGDDNPDEQVEDGESRHHDEAETFVEAITEPEQLQIANKKGDTTDETDEEQRIRPNAASK